MRWGIIVFIINEPLFIPKQVSFILLVIFLIWIKQSLHIWLEPLIKIFSHKKRNDDGNHAQDDGNADSKDPKYLSTSAIDEDKNEIYYDNDLRNLKCNHDSPILCNDAVSCHK